MRKHRYTFTILISSWRCNYSMTRLPSCHSESSGKSTVIPVSGPGVKSQIWPRKGRGFYARQKMSILLLSQYSHKLDVEEANVSVSQFPQNRKLFPRMLVCEWTDSLLLVYDMHVVIEVLHSSKNTHTSRSLRPPAKRSSEHKLQHQV